MKGKRLGWLISGTMLASLMTPLSIAANEQPEWAIDVDSYELAQSTKEYVLAKAGISEEASDADIQQQLHEILDPFAYMDPSQIGALGFFLYEKDYDAAFILAQSVQLGEAALHDPNDAMTLDHFKTSLQYVDDCNRLRKQDGVNPLAVGLPLMAISIVQTDVSAQAGQHSQLYRVGENLAWGYRVGAPMGQGNPFDGWYTQEKNDYLATGNREGNGHYFNIINPDYKLTGTAVNTKSPIASFDTCFGQVFDFENSSVKHLTTDEIRAKIAAYEKALDDGSALPQNPGFKAMFRLYNPHSGEHFYTENFTEKKALVQAGWKYEGFGWYSPESSSSPVYRVYNPNSGDHHYTTNVKERDQLVKVGWKDEGTGWYSEADKGIPVYRQYNPNAKTGSHNYTTNAAERDALVAQGWKDEGIGWYASYGWSTQ